MNLAVPKLIAIVPAAGIGSRANPADTFVSVPKQYRLLKGQSMLRWSVRALLADPRITQVRVAVAPHDAWVNNALAGLPRTVWRPCGGASRAATVLAAIHDAQLAPHDWVLVHDAARPGLPTSALAKLVDHCLAGNLDGGLLALPVSDTVKRSTEVAMTDKVPAIVRSSVARDHLWLAQTPQMFPAGKLLLALEAAGPLNATITDEASALEMMGISPALITGSVRNFKVTWPEDFGLMEAWLEAK